MCLSSSTALSIESGCGLSLASLANARHSFKERALSWVCPSAEFSDLAENRANCDRDSVFRRDSWK
jgi:hypothetical protein